MGPTSQQLRYNFVTTRFVATSSDLACKLAQWLDLREDCSGIARRQLRGGPESQTLEDPRNWALSARTLQAKPVWGMNS